MKPFGSMIAVLWAAFSAPAAAQSAPKFEVVSIKPCKPPPNDGGRGGPGGSNDPGRMDLECRTVRSLIKDAYKRFANGTRPTMESALRLDREPIEGGPGWVDSDRYTIDAKPERTQTLEMMRGPMLQRILEDRFKLKVHRDTREVPVYELTVAKGGPKLRAAADGSCTPVDLAHGPPPPLQPGGKPRCGFFRDNGHGIDTYSTMANLCAQFSAWLDRNVIDKTGIAGMFEIHLAFSFQDLDASQAPNDGAVPAPPVDPSDLISTGVQNLGLKIQAAHGPGELLIIDHVERPSEN
jgi:uncharacterized protein (TIGR03435 family)